MIDYKTIKVGDKVKVVGMGAPGFAKLDDELEITAVYENKVDAKREDGQVAFFALTCGAQRLEKIFEKMNYYQCDYCKFIVCEQQYLKIIYEPKCRCFQRSGNSWGHFKKRVM